MSWKETLGALAPTLATALGGPLAGAATKFIAGKLLGDESADLSDIEKAVLGASPEQLAQLKEIDNEFKIGMKKLDIDVIKISVDNTKSARDMAKINMWPQIVLSAFFVVGYFSILISLGFGYFSLDTPAKDTLILLLGIMTREMPTIMQFWFGSSFGSKNKTEKLTGR